MARTSTTGTTTCLSQFCFADGCSSIAESTDAHLFTEEAFDAALQQGDDLEDIDDFDPTTPLDDVEDDDASDANENGLR